ncbi:hypothetical protein EJA70_04860 [Pseudomonas sp. PB103]|nr:hypothetical protein EJA70_04860 [Pseudomonas sp. PB103]
MSAPSPCHRPNWAQRSEYSCGFQKRTGEAFTPPRLENSTNTVDLLWERACSRWGLHIQHYCRLILRYRWQASSHRVLHSFQHLRFNADHCGSGLARDGAGTSKINVA